MLATTKPKRVLIALSGGVDSSVCVHLLKEQGYEVAGVVFDMSPAHTKTVNAAKDSARSLDIPLFVKNLHKEFNENVISYFVSEYLEGRTPNPCVVCNPLVKFKTLLDTANENNYDYIATGHYVGIDNDNGIFRIKCGDSKQRDQSYMLYRLGQDVLSRLILPLSGFSKDHVREIAANLGLSCATAPDSQDNCFISDNDYTKYIENFCKTPIKKGHFVAPDGTIIGEHKGIIHYTVGQRKGLGVALGKPVFVKKIDPKNGDVFLVEDKDACEDFVFISNVHIISGKMPARPFQCTVKIRSTATPVPAEAIPLESGDMKIVFNTPQRFPAVGQSLVIYNNEYVTGGGWLS